MKRFLAAAVLGVLAASLAPAHFVWIVPEDGSGKAKVVFSDSLKPDDRVNVEKIADTKFFSLDASGKETPLKATLEKAGAYYKVEVPGEGTRVVAGVTDYDVLQRGDSKPFWLTYYAKAIVGDPSTRADLRLGTRVPLELVPVVADGKVKFRVLAAGKPLAKAEVSVLAPGAEAAQNLTADEQGLTRAFDKPGLYGARTRQTENKAGEHKGKKYDEIRRYATLVLHFGPAKASRQPAREAFLALADAKEAKGDPEASRLMAEAYAARAQWKDAPGFRADIEVNIDGKVSKGTVLVPARGKIQYEGLDKEAQAWAAPVLGMAVGHRRDSGSPPACVFVDKDTTHPLGRAVRAVDDPLDSFYRIKGREITVVSRTMHGQKFTITMQENRPNADGKFLPAQYTVSYWDAKTGALTHTEAYTQGWHRVGIYDLPALVRVVTASSPRAASETDSSATPKVKVPAYTARSITLANFRLLEAKGE